MIHWLWKNYNMKLIIYIFLSIFIFGCVSQTEYDNLSVENAILREELYKLRYYPNILLRKAENSLKMRLPIEAEIYLKTLIKNYPESKEALIGNKVLIDIEKIKLEIAEANMWDDAISSNDIAKIETYISSYPTGEFLKEAKSKLRYLRYANEESAYQNAIQSYSSEVWKNFISDYPNRLDIEEIKVKIIALEINEIMNRGDVQPLPNSQETSFGYSDESEVYITNATQYELIVRYRGPNITAITIPAGQSGYITLDSGRYDVAATAGSLSCAGRQDLRGNSTVKYYISQSYN